MTRLIAWMRALGTAGATANAQRECEARAGSLAALDARLQQVAATAAAERAA